MLNLFYSKFIFIDKVPKPRAGAEKLKKNLALAKKVLTEGLGLKPTPANVSSRVLSDVEAKKATRTLARKMRKTPALANQLDVMFNLLKLVKIDFKEQDALQVRFLRDRKTNIALQTYVARNATKWSVLQKIPNYNVFRSRSFTLAFLDNKVVPKGAKISMAKSRDVSQQAKLILAGHKRTSLTTLVILAQKGSRRVQAAVLKRPELKEGRLDIIMRSLGKKPKDYPLYRQLAKHPNVTNSLARDMWLRLPVLKKDLAFNSYLANNKQITGEVIKKIIDRFPSSSPVMVILKARTDLSSQNKAYLKEKTTTKSA